MTGPPNDRLDAARHRAQLTLSELWVRYFAAGGNLGALELDAVLNGALQASLDESDLITQVLNERFVELGAGPPIPYSFNKLGEDESLADASELGVEDELGYVTVAAVQSEPDIDAPIVIRRWARQLLFAHGHQHLADVTASGLTELVTNVCLHARTSMTVSMRLRAGTTVRFHVRDHSPRPPVLRRASAAATSGRGLGMVTACGDWGVLHHPDGKTVWFEPKIGTETAT